LSLLQGAPISILQPALSTYDRNLDSIVNTIHAVGKPRILLCTQYNPFPNTALAAEGIGLLNERIGAAAARHGLAVVPVDAWFAGEEPRLISWYRTGRLEDIIQKPLFAPNPIHPNDLGHARIAQGLVPYLTEIKKPKG
jgi:lysophospholipase L1-like esterase